MIWTTLIAAVLLGLTYVLVFIAGMAVQHRRDRGLSPVDGESTAAVWRHIRSAVTPEDADEDEDERDAREKRRQGYVAKDPAKRFHL